MWSVFTYTKYPIHLFHFMCLKCKFRFTIRFFKCINYFLVYIDTIKMFFWCAESEQFAGATQMVRTQCRRRKDGRILVLGMIYNRIRDLREGLPFQLQQQMLR